MFSHEDQKADHDVIEPSMRRGLKNQLAGDGGREGSQMRETVVCLRRGQRSQGPSDDSTNLPHGVPQPPLDRVAFVDVV